MLSTLLKCESEVSTGKAVNAFQPDINLLLSMNFDLVVGDSNNNNPPPPQKKIVLTCRVQ